jgi:hypothetical protein
MSVQDDVETQLVAPRHQVVKHLQATQSHELGIYGVVDGVRTGAQHVVAPRNAQAVETEVLDGREGGLHVYSPQSVQDVVAGLKSEPANALKDDWRSRWCDDLIATGLPTGSGRNDNARD